MTEQYQELMHILAERYSCRSYDSTRPVSDEDIRAILEAARIAPSACNRQPWRFIVVRDAERRQKLLAKSRPAFMEAPVVVACVGLHDQVWVRPADGKDHTDVDLSIATQQICLAATTLGLGTCWVCSFDVEGTRQALELPETAEPVALIPLGYPKAGTEVPKKTRKPLEDICACEVLGNTCSE